MAKNKKNAKGPVAKKLRCPWTLLRPLFGSLSMLLFLFSLHSLFYVTYVASKSPDCSKCGKQKDDNCYNYCDIPIDDFIYVDDLKDRINLLTYKGVVLFLRCIAFISGFVGVFTFVFYAMIVYLILHFGLIITFLSTIIYFASEEKSLFPYVFGRTTASIVVLSIVYVLELILFSTGLSLSYKFFRMRRQKSSK